MRIVSAIPSLFTLLVTFVFYPYKHQSMLLLNKDDILNHKAIQILGISLVVVGGDNVEPGLLLHKTITVDKVYKALILQPVSYAKAKVI